MFSRQSGFTILETMIVMVVSSVMLIASVTLFSGQQRATRFSQALRDTESLFRDVLNDVGTGYYPNIGTVSCTLAGQTPTINTNSGEQGSSYGCVFLGKAIRLQEDKITIYPVVGNRLIAASASANATLSSAYPIIATQLREERSFQWDMKAHEIYWSDTTPRTAEGGLIVMASTLNGTGFGAGGRLNSGIQKFNLYASGTGTDTSLSLLEADRSSAESRIDDILLQTTLGWPTGNQVVICFEDAESGPGRQKGGIVLTGGNSVVEARIQVVGDGVQCP